MNHNNHKKTSSTGNHPEHLVYDDGPIRSVPLKGWYKGSTMYHGMPALVSEWQQEPSIFIMATTNRLWEMISPCLVNKTAAGPSLCLFFFAGKKWPGRKYLPLGRPGSTHFWQQYSFIHSFIHPLTVILLYVTWSTGCSDPDMQVAQIRDEWKKKWETLPFFITSQFCRYQKEEEEEQEMHFLLPVIMEHFGAGNGPGSCLLVAGLPRMPMNHESF